MITSEYAIDYIKNKDQFEKSVVCPWFRPPLTPPILGWEEISLSIPFPLLS